MFVFLSLNVNLQTNLRCIKSNLEESRIQKILISQASASGSQ